MDLLDELEPRKQPSNKNYTILVLQIILILAYIISLLFTLDDIKTIVVSGPVVGCIAAALLIVAIVKKNNKVIIGSSIAMGLPIFLFLTILVFNIRPSQASDIVPPVCAVFLLAYVPVTIFQMTRDFRAD